MFHCDWSVAGRLMRQMSLTRTHHATVVGPIRFSNRSNNCRVCKINGRQLSLVRTHHATIVFSSSLRPTDDKNRMVCAGLKGTAKYPLRPVDCKVYSIAQGAMSHTHENLFLGTLPKRIILWCVDNDAFNGTFEKNPFHAKNNAINFLAIYVDGRQVPAKPLQPNFETGQYIRSYVNLFSATGKHAQDLTRDLTRLPSKEHLRWQ